MVQFEYQPWKKVIVHEVIKWPIEQFLLTRSRGVPDGAEGRPLSWVNGIVFDYQGMPPTPEIVKENLHGKIHWSSITYGTLEKFQEEFILPRQVKIRIIDPVLNL